MESHEYLYTEWTRHTEEENRYNIDLGILKCKNFLSFIWYVLTSIDEIKISQMLELGILAQSWVIVKIARSIFGAKQIETFQIPFWR